MSQTMQVMIDLENKNLNCNESLSEVIGEYLVKNKLTFFERMSRVSQQYCQRAAVNMDSFSVSNAILENDTYYVNVAVEWGSSFGFEGKNKSESLMEKWRFNIVNNHAVFELDLPELHISHEI